MRRYAILCIVMLLLLAGCSSSSGTVVEKATALPVFSPIPPSPTITATITPTPYPEITPMPVISGSLSERTVQSVCLEIKQGPETASTVPLSAGLRDDVALMLRANGIHAVEPGGECDARLEITLSVEAVAGNYTGGWCYSGSQAQGMMALTASGATRDEVEIKEGISPPFVVTGCNKNPSSAPVSLAVSLALFEGFSQIWGYDFLANVIRRTDVPSIHRNMAADFCADQALTEKGLVVNCLVATAEEMANRQGTALNHLAFLKRDALAAVPALIGMLEEPLKPTPTVSAFFPNQGDVKEQVTEALRAITGQDFGADGAQWRKWWEENGQSLFPTPVPCSDYLRMMGSQVQVSGVIDYSDQMDFGMWIDFAGKECSYSAQIFTEQLSNFEPEILQSLKPGWRVTLTGTITDVVDRYVILDIVSIDSLEPPG